MRRNGFTLLEMLIVLAMIGILAAVTIPAIAGRSKSFEVVDQARRLHTEVSKLRSRAVAEGKRFELSLVDGTAFEIERLETGGAKTLIRTQTIDGGTATMNDADAGTITFYPTGRVDVTTDIRFMGGPRVHVIRVLASGMTRWETE